MDSDWLSIFQQWGPAGGTLGLMVVTVRYLVVKLVDRAEKESTAREKLYRDFIEAREKEAQRLVEIVGEYERSAALLTSAIQESAKERAINATQSNTEHGAIMKGLEAGQSALVHSFEKLADRIERLAETRAR